MIEEIALENFKAFGEKQTISLAPLTLIYGQNSAGKSSIIQSLFFMKQSLESGEDGIALKPYMYEGVDLGSYKELLHNQDVKNKFSFSFQTTNPMTRSPLYVYSDSKREPRTLNTTLYFDCLKSKTPFLEKVCVTSSVNGLEEIYFSLDLVKSSAQKHSKDLREGNPLNFKLSELKLAKEHLSRMYDWLIENFQWVQNQRKKWVAQEMNISEAEFDKDIKRIQDGLDEQIKFFDNKPSYEEFQSYVESLLKSESFQFFGLDFDTPRKMPFRAHRETTNFFLLALPFDRDVASFTHKQNSPSGRRFAFFTKRLSPFNIKNYLGEALFHLDRNLNKSVFLGPIRSQPHRFYSSSGVRPKTVGYSGERTPDLIQNDPKILKETNKWLKKLEMGYEIKAQDISRKASLFELSLKDLRNKQDSKLRVTLKDVGFGVSQVLPIIVQCIHSKNETILIEQPELHIHPRLQADLADLFIYSMTERSNRLIIETHSEHLVLRIAKQLKRREDTVQNFSDEKIEQPSKVKEAIYWAQRRKQIEQKYPNEYTPDPINFDAEKILVNFVSRSDVSGSIVHKIRFTHDGEFKDRWPGGFFPERRREIVF